MCMKILMVAREFTTHCVVFTNIVSELIVDRSKIEEDGLCEGRNKFIRILCVSLLVINGEDLHNSLLVSSFTSL